MKLYDIFCFYFDGPRPAVLAVAAAASKRSARSNPNGKSSVYQ